MEWVSPLSCQSPTRTGQYSANQVGRPPATPPHLYRFPPTSMSVENCGAEAAIHPSRIRLFGMVAWKKRGWRTRSIIPKNFSFSVFPLNSSSLLFQVANYLQHRAQRGILFDNVVPTIHFVEATLKEAHARAHPLAQNPFLLKYLIHTSVDKNPQVPQSGCFFLPGGVCPEFARG